VLIYLDETSRRALEALADREGRSVSAQGRYMILQQLKEAR
jgi:hypothetical protein